MRTTQGKLHGEHPDGSLVPRTVLWFAYDGFRFDGYAPQANPALRTVEGALMEGLLERDIVESQEAAGMRTGSRTDRGVSARRNALTLEARIPAHRVASALGTTVLGLWPLSSAQAPEGFNPRQAISRTYRYQVDSSWVPSGMEVDELQDIAGRFVGTHDMTAFARVEPGRNPVREMHTVRAEQNASGFVVEFEGRNFLWRQVRRMMAAVLAVANGQVDAGVINRSLEDPAGAPDLGQAPAGPLVLWDVKYRNVSCGPNLDAAHARRLEAAFANERADAAARAAIWR